MTVEEARELLAYGSWANALFFQAADALSEEQAYAVAGGSFPSVAGTLGHIVGAEWVWLRRWLGESPSGMPSWVAKPSVPDVKARLAEVESERSGFLSQLRQLGQTPPNTDLVRYLREGK
jgi:uncharacterized damage-inducible protein DinB